MSESSSKCWKPFVAKLGNFTEQGSNCEGTCVITTGQMIDLCCEYLSSWCIWLYVLIMSRTNFRVNLHCIVAWMASLAKWLSVRLRTKWMWFVSPCSYLNFRYRASFEQGVPWHSGNYRVWIHSKTRPWHDKNIQSKRATVTTKCPTIVLVK